MKAKLVVTKTQTGLILEDNTEIIALKDESPVQFVKRVTKDRLVSNPDEEFKVQQLAASSLEKATDAQIEKAIGANAGIMKEFFTEVLDGRKNPVGKKAKAEKKEKEVKAEKKAKEPKAPVVKRSLEEVQAKADSLKGNVNHKITFRPHGTAIATEGVIKAVWVDQRVPMAYYGIVGEDKRHNKSVYDETLTIGEKVEDKREAIAAAKLAAKKEKAEAAEKAKVEKAEAKEAAKKEKAEATAKVKAEKEAKAAEDEAKAAEIAAKEKGVAENKQSKTSKK